MKADILTDDTPFAAAAQAAVRLLHRLSPVNAAAAEPFVLRLFDALAQGDTLVYVDDGEAAALNAMPDLVGRDGDTPLVLRGRQLFLAKYFRQEQELARHIRRIMQAACTVPEPAAVLDKLQQWFADEGSFDQQAACTLALLQPFMLISGGPGTGKTTTVAKLLALLCSDGSLPRIALVAPTGKAGARLSQALQNAVGRLKGLPDHVAEHLQRIEGQTVHRLLGLKPPLMQPAYNERHPLPVDILLIDEASMLDNHLCLQLLKAVADGCRVILLGDTEQLPSVGAGAVLEALTQTPPLTEAVQKALHTYLPHRRDWQTLSQQHARLTRSHRFGENSAIGQLARAVLDGGAKVGDVLAAFPDALQQHENDADQIARMLWQRHQAYWQAVDGGDVQAAFAEQQKCVVLTALRHDAERINRHYTQRLQVQRHIAPNAAWFAGQIILITRNAPAQQLYNGDVGIIMQPAQAETGLTACFAHGESYRSVPLSRLPEHETAFALTVHKSQGSEYGEVWYAAPEQAAVSRALLYTAITRAKEKFAYWGSMESFHAACRQAERRHTALDVFLREKQPALFD